MTRPEPSDEQRAAARQVCPCWSDGRTGSPACIVDDGVSCELHSAIADAFAEREAGLRAEVDGLAAEVRAWRAREAGALALRGWKSTIECSEAVYQARTANESRGWPKEER